MAFKMLNHAPISWALSPMGRCFVVINLSASIRISKMLLIRAKRGARGKAAMNRVTNPYWITENKKLKLKLYLIFVEIIELSIWNMCFVRFLDPLHTPRNASMPYPLALKRAHLSSKIKKLRFFTQKTLKNIASKVKK